IRKTAKRLGLGTDASHRFERGVDPEGTVRAINRASELMLAVTGGQDSGGHIDEHPNPTPPRTIDLRVSDTNRLLGISISKQEVEDLLAAIEINTTPVDTQIDSDLLRLSIPSFRVDLHLAEDLMEEVARRYGYEKIPTTMPRIKKEHHIGTAIVPLRESIRQKMIGYGFFEIITYSFIHPDAGDRLRLAEGDPRRETTRILNPLTEDQAVMRTSLLPGLLDTMGRNLAKQNKALRFFETGKIFLDQGPGKQPLEREMIAGLWTGARMEESWHRKPTPCDFYDIKGIVASLLANFRLEAVIYTQKDPAKSPYLRPGFSAMVSAGSTPIGVLGELHPDILPRFELKQTAYLFELNLDGIIAIMPEPKHVKALSKYPATTRDVTLILDNTIETDQILDQARSESGSLVENVFLFDVFEGEPISKGKKSLSFRITYRSATKTLEDETVNAIHKQICDRIIKDFGADLP
ncbi:MAG: phenylalanine--tRNA ligase subunit beta, partial [Deltaproteobacteria bacterium]|nr:phenylalanine--tRNA ligase subunit beta [Deltaproteobacteria bacterium]